MQPINLQILFADGNIKVVKAVAADLIAFEERFDMSIAKLAENVRLTHLFFIAWHVLKRTKETTEDFETWSEGVDAVAEADSKK